MHELSITMGIIRIAEEKARERNAPEIKEICLEIGSLAGIQIDALDFAWSVATRNTMLEKARRKIIDIPARATCSECEKDFELHHIYDACPSCGSYFKHIYSGKELRIKYIEI